MGTSHEDVSSHLLPSHGGYDSAAKPSTGEPRLRSRPFASGHRRPCFLLFPLLLIGAAFIFFAHSSPTPDTTLSRYAPPPPSTPFDRVTQWFPSWRFHGLSGPVAPSLKYQKLTNGRWAPYDRVVGQEDILKEWGRNARAGGASHRALTAASWKWEPEGGRMIEWDAFDFVKRSINSDVGTVLIGGKLRFGDLDAKRAGRG